jgi:hypothetical protein
MANIAGKIGLKVLTIIVGIPVGIVAKKVIEKAWHAARPADPPRKPAERDARWQDVIAWAALSAAGVVAADLVSRRSAEVAYRTLIGTEPPVPKQRQPAT